MDTKNIGVAELAKALDVSESTVEKWRAGKALSVSVLIAIADFLDVTADELTGVKNKEIKTARDDYDEDDDDNDDEYECYPTDNEGKARRWKWKRKGTEFKSFKKFPYSMLCVTVYLLLGFAWGLWHPAWLIFLSIPVYSAAFEEKPSRFPFPLLVIGAYLLIGFVWNGWHPWWIIFLTVPAYYLIVSAIEKK